MPWRNITLVPFRSSVGSSPLDVMDSANSDVEIISDQRVAEEQRSEPLGQTDSEQDPGFGSLCGEDTSDWERVGESPIEHQPRSELTGDFETASINSEVADRVEPTVSSSSFRCMVNHSFLSSVPLHNIEMPWEQGVAKLVFGEDPQLGDGFKVQPLLTDFDIVRNTDETTDPTDAYGKTLELVKGFNSSSFFSAVSNLADVSYTDKKKLELSRACAKWLSILELCPGASSVSSHLQSDDSDGAAKSNVEVVESIIGVRSASTASSRANVLRKLLEWVFVNFPSEPNPLAESLVWQYFSHLRSTGAAATSAASTMSALRYAQHIFGFENLSTVTSSRRLIGSSEIMFSMKDPTKQALVLTVDEVLTLHSKLVDSSLEVFDRIGSGYLLMCLYGRCRHSDLANVDHMDHEHTSDSGFIEIFTRHHKTARGAAKKAMLLPILIPAVGIDNRNWVQVLHELMEGVGLCFEGKVGGPILRPPTAVGSEALCQRGLTSDECGRLLRSLLGLPIDSPGKGETGVTSHSLKATGLSWATKFGIQEYDRAVLGRHASSTSSATAIYARDLAFPSVKKFQCALLAIFNKTFRPDAPRSQYFAEGANSSPSNVQNQVEEDATAKPELLEVKDEDSVVVPSWTDVELVCSSSESEQDSSGSDSTQDEEPEHIVEQPKKFRRIVGPESTGASWMFHKRSGILHLCDNNGVTLALGGRFFRCGRVVGNNYCPMTDKESGNPMCIVCNRRSGVNS